MKIILLILAMAVPSAFPTLAIADMPNQVSLHYTGTIVFRPCDISIGTTTNLDMGDLDITSLSVKGATSPWLNYIVKFSNCDLLTNIKIGSSLLGNKWDNYASSTFDTYDSNLKYLKDIGLDVFTEVSVTPNPNMVEHYNNGSNWITISPVQRKALSGTGYLFPLKFRFRNLTGAVPPSGNITGVYVLSVEYD